MDSIPLPSDWSAPAAGQFPARFTQDERFQFAVKVQPVAGQLEFSIRPVDTRLSAMAAQRQWMGFPKRGVVQSEAKDPEDSRRRSRLRAKGMVRLLALELKVDRMLTFTIRNTGTLVTYEQLLKAWDLFRRMAERWDPTFRYLATPERQKSGQWHIHAGVHGYVNIKIITRMWQSALNRMLGRSQSLIHGPDSPGTCNIRAGQLRGSQGRRSTKIASYISKYIGKELDVALNKKKYFHTYGVKVTPAQRRWLEAGSRDDAISEVLGLYGLVCANAEGVLRINLPTIWMRDGCSAWFSVDAAGIPPPF
jgi:hypothetical protein